MSSASSENTLMKCRRWSGIQFPSQLKLCIHRTVFGMLRDVDTKQFKTTIFIVSNNSISPGEIHIRILLHIAVAGCEGF